MADHDTKMLIRKWELWQADHGISAYPTQSNVGTNSTQNWAMKPA